MSDALRAKHLATGPPFATQLCESELGTGLWGEGEGYYAAQIPAKKSKVSPEQNANSSYLSVIFVSHSAYSNPNRPPPCFKIEIGLYNLKNFPEFQSAP